MYELYELMAFLCGVQDDTLTEYEISNLFYETYEIDEDQFRILIEDLLPLCIMVKSPLTDTWYQGFGSNGLWLMKQQITE